MRPHHAGDRLVDVTTATSHGIRAATLTPPHIRHTCVVSMGYGAWLEPFELQRFALLAKLLHAKLIVVESPGLGYPDTALTWRERRALMTGRFRPLGRRMLAAATRGLEPETAIHLLGYSMGASIVAAMVAENEDVTFRSVTLVEPVGIRRWNPAALIAAVRHEDRGVDAYLQETADITGSVAPWDRNPVAPGPHQSRLDQLLLPAALCRGRLREDLVEATPSVPILLVHGQDSKLSTTEDVAKFVRTLRGVDVDVTDRAAEGGHGLWLSLPRVEKLGGIIAAFWSAP